MRRSDNPLEWRLRVTMPNGDQYEVPVEAIARDRARSYADEFGGDVERSLREDTLPLFLADSYNVEDWAENNMNWEDVAAIAVKVVSRPELSKRELQEGWINGEKEIVE